MDDDDVIFFVFYAKLNAYNVRSRWGYFALIGILFIIVKWMIPMGAKKKFFCG